MPLHLRENNEGTLFASTGFARLRDSAKFTLLNSCEFVLLFVHTCAILTFSSLRLHAFGWPKGEDERALIIYPALTASEVGRYERVVDTSVHGGVPPTKTGSVLPDSA